MSSIDTSGLTQEQLDAIKRILQPSIKPESPFHSPNVFGYIINVVDIFETFVAWNEANDISSALEVALKDKHQSWHRVGGEDLEGHHERQITHDEYCDWLRRE